MGTNADDSVRQLYEQFPYPRPTEDLSAIIAGQQSPAWNPHNSFSLYFPDRPATEELDVLIAGCGTSTAAHHAAYLPHMRFVAIDLAEQPLLHAQRLCERHGLKNIEFVQLPIERVAELGRQFDFVSCHGVLHHMADPAQGLRALGSVTRPDGVLSLMVYAKYGRTGIYMLQEFFRDRLKLDVGQENVATVQAALKALPEEHPFRIIHKDRAQAISLEEIADMILHPRDRAYTVSDVRALVDEAGLQFQRWMGQAQYSPEVSPLSTLPLAGFAGMDRWERWAAMELFHGTIIKHEFVVSHLGRPRHEDLFAVERLENAVPHLSGHFAVAREGDQVILTNTQHQFPYRLTLPLAGELALLKRIDGRRTVAEITALARADGMWSQPSAAHVFRLFYLADVVDFSTTAS